MSTNGAIFGHPNDEAIARMILHGGGPCTVWFNYRTDRTAKWGGDDLRRRYGYSTNFPEADGAGVAIMLKGKSIG